MKRLSTIDKIVASQVVDRTCNALAGDLADDLRQHLYLTFCQMEEGRLAEIFAGNFDSYVLRCVITALHSGSSFKRNHNAPREELSDFNTDDLRAVAYDIHAQIDASDTLAKIEAALAELYWYERDLFRLYIKVGSVRGVQQKVGIQYVSAWKTVNKVKKHLRERLQNESIDSNA